jgi:hypothetical protein
MERIAITSREQWLALRQRDVTASVAAVLIADHPHISRLGLYLLKSKIVTEDPDETPPMRRGRLLEPVALALLREQNPTWQIEAPGAYFRDPDVRLGATPDAIAVDDAGKIGVIQIKSIEKFQFQRAWVDGDEITPPLWIAVQALVEKHLVGADWAAVAALVVSHGIDIHLIMIPHIAGVIDRLKSEVAAFWSRVERGDPPAPDFSRDGSLIAQQFVVEAGKTIDLRDDNALPALAAEDGQLGEELKAAKARREAVRTEIIAKMGDADTALFQGGRITAKMVRRKPYMVGESTYRDVRIKPELRA